MDQKITRLRQISSVLNKPYNKATKYLLPMFGEKNTLLVDDEGITFLNVFIEDVDKPYLDNHIFILYELKDATKMCRPLTKIYATKQYHSSYSFANDGKTYTVVIFTIPIRYKKDYKNITIGKYNEASLSYKKAVLEYWDIKDTNSSTYRILFNIIDTMDNRNLSAAWPDFRAGFGEEEILPEKPFDDHYHGSDDSEED